MATPLQSLDAANKAWNQGCLDRYLELYDDEIRLHGYTPEPMDKPEVRGLPRRRVHGRASHRRRDRPPRNHHPGLSRRPSDRAILRGRHARPARADRRDTSTRITSSASRRECSARCGSARGVGEVLVVGGHQERTTDLARSSAPMAYVSVEGPCLRRVVLRVGTRRRSSLAGGGDVRGGVEHAAQRDHLAVRAEGPHVDHDLVDAVAVREIGGEADFGGDLRVGDERVE